MSHAPIARVDNAADPYRWLENRDSAEVLDYLKAENAYLEQQLSEQLPLRETLFEEIKARIRETDLSLPSPWGPYLYYQRTTAGDEYPRHYRCRKPADGALTVDEASEQLLLDPNALADGGFISLGAFSISPDHQRLAYSLDTSGEETYQLFVKELADDSLIELPFEECDGSMTWANDSQTLFFGELDDTHRPHKLYRHRLGTDAAELVFHEKDGRFFLSCYRSSSERQLIVHLGSKTTSEAWVLDAATPQAAFSCVAPREEGHEYDVDHGTLNGEWSWLIRSNQHGINFALFSASESAPSRAHSPGCSRTCACCLEDDRAARRRRRLRPVATGVATGSSRIFFRWQPPAPDPAPAHRVCCCDQSCHAPHARAARAPPVASRAR